MAQPLIPTARHNGNIFAAQSQARRGRMLSRLGGCSGGRGVAGGQSPAPGAAARPVTHLQSPQRQPTTCRGADTTIQRRRDAVACRALEQYMVDKLMSASQTFKEMQLRMADPDVAGDVGEFQRVAKAAAELEPMCSAFARHKELQGQLEDSRAYLKEVQDDFEMAEFAREEISELDAEQSQLEEDLKRLLLPKDPMDDRNIMLEIRAGAGGDEAGIWAGDLYRMYTRHVCTHAHMHGLAECTHSCCLGSSRHLYCYGKQSC
eukprot:363049-Chlamydomonas_euryale.AAC.21